MPPTILKTQPCNEIRAPRKVLRCVAWTETASRCGERRHVAGNTDLRRSSPTGS